MESCREAEKALNKFRGTQNAPSASESTTNGLIPYIVLDKSELRNIKLSIDVEVLLVGGRLPNETELGALSKHLVSQVDPHERSFITFYLPEMKVGEGAFATAHHNPDMEVNIRIFTLIQYPKYKMFVPLD